MSRNNEYRREIDESSMPYEDLVDYGYDDNKTLLIPEHTVKEVLDKIEGNINDVKDLLNNIKGLSEVDEIKDLINELSEKLY